MSGALKMYTENSNGGNRSYVELFAGCGGMSLGIESVGFKRVFANELSPMAAATYAYNLIHKKSPTSENPEEWFTRLYSPGKRGDYQGDPRAYLKKGERDMAQIQYEILQANQSDWADRLYILINP